MPISREQFEDLPEFAGATGETTKQVVLKNLTESDTAMTQKELATTTGRREQSINRQLHELMNEGKVKRAKTKDPDSGRMITYYIAVKETAE